MRKRHCRRHGAEVKFRPIAKRSARASEPQTALTAILFRSAGQTLKDRIVFAVNGQHHCSVFAHGLLKQLSAANDAFLVGMQDALSGLGCSKGGGHPCRTHHGNDHCLCFVVGSKLHCRFRAAQNLDVTFSGFLQKVRESVSLGGICNSHALDAETNRDVGKLFNVAVRGNGKEPKFVRIKSQHFQRTLAHGAGGSQ